MYFNYGAAADWGKRFRQPARGMFLKPNIAVSSEICTGLMIIRNLASPSDTVPFRLPPNMDVRFGNAWGARKKFNLSYGFRYTSDIGSAVITADNISVISSLRTPAPVVRDGGINDSLITEREFLEERVQSAVPILMERSGK
jgi:hypothetical protein